MNLQSDKLPEEELLEKSDLSFSHGVLLFSGDSKQQSSQNITHLNNSLRIKS